MGAMTLALVQAALLAIVIAGILSMLMTYPLIFSTQKLSRFARRIAKGDFKPVSGHIVSKELSELVAKTVGYEGKIVWDTTKPNGTPRKLLDVSKAEALGWRYHTELEEGLKISYEDFLNNPMRAER